MVLNTYGRRLYINFSKRSGFIKIPEVTNLKILDTSEEEQWIIYS